MPNTVTERRRHRRIELEGMKIRAKTVISSECKILDMGVKGICIATTQQLNFGHAYSIAFNLEGRRISDKGMVRWVKLAGKKKGRNQDSLPVYLTGLEFENVLSKYGKEIIQVLEEYSENTNQRRGSRLKIKAPGKTVFNILQEFPVRQISSGGMLLESDIALPADKTFPWVFSPSGSDSTIRCTGRVISCFASFSASRIHYKTRIAFSDLAGENRIILARFLMRAATENLKASLLN